jgi:hypothetical protein
MSVTVVTPGRSSRAARLASSLRPAPWVVTWRPMAAAGAGAVVVLALSTPAQVPLRMSMAGACLAASAAYVIDDPAAATVASSPTHLSARRTVRTAVGIAGAGVGWIAVLLVSGLRVDGVAAGPATLEVAALLVLGLAASALAATIGDGTEGAIAGVVATMVCFASRFLPGPSWLPLPPEPTAPGAAGRLLLVLATAAAVLAVASRDPAAPRRLARQARPRNHEPASRS